MAYEENQDFDINSILSNKPKKTHILHKYAASKNIVDDLDEEVRQKL